MKTKNQFITELENFWYDCQYGAEKSKDLETVRNELCSNIYILKDMESKRYDTSSMICKIEELKSQIEEGEHSLFLLKEKMKFVQSNVDSLVQPYKNILFLRYLKNYSFNQIASKMNYSSKRIYQLHKDAISAYIEFCNQNCR